MVSFSFARALARLCTTNLFNFNMFVSIARFQLESASYCLRSSEWPKSSSAAPVQDLQPDLVGCRRVTQAMEGHPCVCYLRAGACAVCA